MNTQPEHWCQLIELANGIFVCFSGTQIEVKLNVIGWFGRRCAKISCMHGSGTMKSNQHLITNLQREIEVKREREREREESSNNGNINQEMCVVSINANMPNDPNETDGSFFTFGYFIEWIIPTSLRVPLYPAQHKHKFKQTIRWCLIRDHVWICDEINTRVWFSTFPIDVKIHFVLVRCPRLRRQWCISPCEPGTGCVRWIFVAFYL